MVEVGINQHPAIYSQRSAGDVTGQIARQKRRDTLDFFRFVQPVHGDFLAEVAQAGRVTPLAGVDRRADRTWAMARTRTPCV
jgi:hypothetical protein